MKKKKKKKKKSPQLKIGDVITPLASYTSS